jgi:hypothetical protein
MYTTDHNKNQAGTIVGIPADNGFAHVPNTFQNLYCWTGLLCGRHSQDEPLITCSLLRVSRSYIAVEEYYICITTGARRLVQIRYYVIRLSGWYLNRLLFDPCVHRFCPTLQQILAFRILSEWLLFKIQFFFTPSFVSVLLTYSLHTPLSRVLLEKLIGFQLVKKFPAFYRTRRFVTWFTSARHLPLSWARLIQSVPHIPLPEDPS